MNFCKRLLQIKISSKTRVSADDAEVRIFAIRPGRRRSYRYDNSLLTLIVRSFVPPPLPSQPHKRCLQLRHHGRASGLQRRRASTLVPARVNEFPESRDSGVELSTPAGKRDGHVGT